MESYSSPFSISSSDIVDLNSYEIEDLSPMCQRTNGEEEDSEQGEKLRSMSFENIMDSLDRNNGTPLASSKKTTSISATKPTNPLNIIDILNSPSPTGSTSLSIKQPRSRLKDDEDKEDFLFSISPKVPHKTRYCLFYIHLSLIIDLTISSHLSSGNLRRRRRTDFHSKMLWHRVVLRKKVKQRQFQGFFSLVSGAERSGLIIFVEDNPTADSSTQSPAKPIKNYYESLPKSFEQSVFELDADPDDDLISKYLEPSMEDLHMHNQQKVSDIYKNML